jgi:multidrug efflux pump subunit AcrA (membrane-fusion protein)
MHEPWPLHENFNPTVLADILTDRDPLPSTVKEEEVKNAGTSTSATTATPPSGQSTEVLAGTGTELPEEGASPAPGGPENATTEESGTKLSPEQENAKLAADLAQAEAQINRVDEQYKATRAALIRALELQLELQNLLITATASGNTDAISQINSTKIDNGNLIKNAQTKIDQLKAEANILNSRIRDLKAQIAATK